MNFREDSWYSRAEARLSGLLSAEGTVYRITQALPRSPGTYLEAQDLLTARMGASC